MNGSEEELKLKSPLRIFGILTVSIFVIEAGIMLLLHFLTNFPKWFDEFIDAGILTLLLLPIIYYFVFRPMVSYIAKITNISVALKEERESLNTVVESLKKSRKEWESTFDAISDPIFIHDKELKVIRANLAYQQAAGMSLSGMSGKPYYGVFPKMEGPFRMCLKAQELQEEEEEEEEEVFLPYLEKTFLVRFYPIKDAQGRYLYSIHTMEDITGRKKAEKEIMERIDELERFRKATVTREFRIKELKDENEQLKRKLGIK